VKKPEIFGGDEMTRRMPRDELALKECSHCGGDGWVKIMDPHHYGVVIGGAPCSVCSGRGLVSDPDDDTDLDPVVGEPDPVLEVLFDVWECPKCRAMVLQPKGRTLVFCPDCHGNALSEMQKVEGD
jgi:hypothetical protein